MIQSLFCMNNKPAMVFSRASKYRRYSMSSRCFCQCIQISNVAKAFSGVGKGSGPFNDFINFNCFSVMFNRDSIEIKELYQQCQSLDHHIKFTSQDVEALVRQMQVWPLISWPYKLNVWNVSLDRERTRSCFTMTWYALFEFMAWQHTTTVRSCSARRKIPDRLTCSAGIHN